MDSELSDSMLRIIRDVSKDPHAISNRRLLNQEQLEKENKSLRKWLSNDSINNIVREYSMDSKPKVKENRLSRRIQNALRRDEIEGIDEPIPMPVTYDESEAMIAELSRSHDMGGGYEGEISESPTQPLPF
jgi:hypothetical protein